MHAAPLIFAYYDWDGDPCRVIDPADGINDVAAELYIGGGRFNRVALSEMRREAWLINEAEFAALVKATDVRRQPQ